METGALRLNGRLPIVDAHMHVWDLTANYHPWLCDGPAPTLRYGDYTPLRRTYLPSDYRRDTAGLEIIGAVYVEAEWNPADPLGETRWVHELAAAEGMPSAMVAQAWLGREDTQELLETQARFPLVRGVRHKPVPAARTDARARGGKGTLSDPSWLDGFALLERLGLSFDLQIAPWHLPEAAELAADFPGVPIIIDHTGQCDDRSEEGLTLWRSALETAARQTSMFLKISGLGVRGCRWSFADNAPVIRDAIAIFGADRCMFASNFPVDSLVGDFKSIYAGFLAAVEERPEHELHSLFHGNAERVYRLHGHRTIG
jgi:predicted TIM-barrel fold metal-dependent hydrolase